MARRGGRARSVNLPAHDSHGKPYKPNDGNDYAGKDRARHEGKAVVIQDSAGRHGHKESEVLAKGGQDVLEPGAYVGLACGSFDGPRQGGPRSL